MEGDLLGEGAVLTGGGAKLLDIAPSERHLTERKAETALRAARPVADLALSKHVEAEHVAEALGFQRVDVDASEVRPS